MHFSMLEKFTLVAIVITGTTVIACAISSPEAKGDSPPLPACVFDGEPTSIFCTGQFGEKCFVCYTPKDKLIGVKTECWSFERQRCYH